MPKGAFQQQPAVPSILPTADAAIRREIELAAMDAVMRAEEELGFQPRDVSKENRGYDIESIVPESLRKGGNILRMIEVKGRAAGAPTVFVSKNEIMTGLNNTGSFILAVVAVDGKERHVTYLVHPFTNPPDFAATGVTYDLGDLLKAGEIALEK